MSRIEFRDTLNLADSTRGSFDAWSTSITDLKHLMSSFTDAIDMKGQTAQNMGAYFTEVHGAILDAWQDCIAYYCMVLNKYNRELLEVDSNPHAVIDESYVDEFAYGLYNFRSNFLDTDDSVRSFNSNFSHILESALTEVTTAAGSAIEQMIEQTAKDAAAQLERMGQLDYRFYNEAYAEVERLLGEIKAASERNLLLKSCGTFYTAGYFSNEGFADKLSLSDGAIDRMVESFFIGYCPVNGVNAHALNTIANMIQRHPNDLSNLELQVLLRLMGDTRFTYDNMSDAFINALMRRPTNVTDTMARLAGDFSMIFFELFDNHVLGEPGHLCEDALAAQLRRSQVLTFLSALSARDVPFSIDFTNFDQPNGTIGFNDSPNSIFSSYTQKRVSTLDCLLMGTYLATNFRQTAKLTETEIRTGVEDLWRTHGITLVWKGAGYIPYVGKIFSGADGAMSLGRAVNELNDRGIVLSNAQIAFIESMNSYAAGRLGGGVASVETPHGYRQVGMTLTSQKAMVNLAGLQSMHSLSQDDVMQALIEGPSNPHHATVNPFVPVSSRPRAPFMSELNDTLRDNLSAILEQFGAAHPGEIYIGRQIFDLPMPVVYELIRLHGGG